MSYILPLLLALALMTALEKSPPARVALYLWAQLVYIPFIWVARYLWGDWSWRYASIYILFTALILYTIGGIVRSCIKMRRYWLRALVAMGMFSAILTRVAVLGLERPVDRFLVISVVEGFFLVLAGGLALFSAPFTHWPGLYLGLGLFWLVQAGYSLLWSLHGHLWERWNWTVPPGMGILFFTWLAVRLGSSRPHRGRAGQLPGRRSGGLSSR